MRSHINLDQQRSVRVDDELFRRALIEVLIALRGFVQRNTWALTALAI